MLRAAGDVYGIDVGDLRGAQEDARTAGLVLLDNVLVVNWEGTLCDADLTTVHAAPDEAFALVSDACGVVAAARELFHTDAREIGDLGRLYDDCTIAACAFRNAGLAVAVKAPGPDIVVLVDGEVVEAACGNGLDLLDSEFGGVESGSGVALDDATAKLHLLTNTPGIDVALLVESKDMVGAAADVDDVLQLWQKHWCRLDAVDIPAVVGAVEAKDTLVALGDVSMYFGDAISRHENG